MEPDPNAKPAKLPEGVRNSLLAESIGEMTASGDDVGGEEEIVCMTRVLNNNIESRACDCSKDEINQYH